jgi:hypothetical protein
MVFSLCTGLVIAFVMLSGCSEKPGVQPGITTPPGDNPVTYPATTSAITPVSKPFTFGTSAPLSLSCPGGYVPGSDGGNRCYAQCNPGKHCGDPDDFCCGTNCCSTGSVCCGGNCYLGPCECSGGDCLSSYGEKTGSYVERPGVVINEHY